MVYQLLLCCLVAVAVAKKEPRIHYGSVVSQRQVRLIYPFVVGIMACRLDGTCDVCTGSLVTSDKILAAAHCFCDFSSIDVYFKTTKIQSGHKVSAYEVWTNGKYTCGSEENQFENDVAVLKLESPIINIKPVPLDCRRGRIGEKTTIIGFGDDELGKGGTLKVGYQKLGKCPGEIGRVLCSNANNRRKDLIDHGDSGGPLLVQKGNGFAQLGIQVGEATWSSDFSEDTAQIFNPVKPHCEFIFR